MRGGVRDFEKIWSGAFLKETSLPRQSEEERRAIDSVLFSIWANYQKRRPGLQTSGIVLLSRVFGTVFSLIGIPRALGKALPEVIFSAVLASATAFALSLSDGSKVFVFALSIFLILKHKETIFLLRCLLFDIGDVLAMGFLTTKYIKDWEIAGPIKQISDKGFKFHLFTTRSQIGGECDEELTSAQAFFSKPSVTEQDRCKAIEGYWSEYPLNNRYWSTKPARDYR